MKKISFESLYRNILRENNLLIEDANGAADPAAPEQQSQSNQEEEQTPVDQISQQEFIQMLETDKRLNLEKFKEIAIKFQNEFPIKEIISLCILPAEISIRFPEHFQPYNYRLEKTGTTWNTEDPIDTDEERELFEKFITGDNDNPFHPLFYKALLFYIRAAYKEFAKKPQLLKAAAKEFGFELLKGFGVFSSLFANGFGLGKFFQNNDLNEAKQRITKSINLMNSLIKKINDLMNDPDFEIINELSTSNYKTIKLNDYNIEGPGIYSLKKMQDDADSILKTYNFEVPKNITYSDTVNAQDRLDAKKWREYIKAHPDADFDVKK